MDEFINIKDGITIKKSSEEGLNTITMLRKFDEVFLSIRQTNDNIKNDFVSNDNYIVAYTLGNLSHFTVYSIDSIYDLKNNKLLLEPSDKVKEIATKMIHRGELLNAISVDELNCGHLRFFRKDKC